MLRMVVLFINVVNSIGMFNLKEVVIVKVKPIILGICINPNVNKIMAKIFLELF